MTSLYSCEISFEPRARLSPCEMHTTKPILFCSLIVGTLSATQTDAFARWGHHRHGGFHGNFAALDNRMRADDLRRLREDSKYHAVLDHSGEKAHDSRLDVKKINPVSPEMITLSNGITHNVSIDNGQLTTIGTRVLGIVQEDEVSARHPESRTKSAAMTKCGHDPSSPGC